jgi:Ribosomal protein L4/L1 family
MADDTKDLDEPTTADTAEARRGSPSASGGARRTATPSAPSAPSASGTSPAEGGGKAPRRAPRKKAEDADEGPLSVPAYDANGERSGRAQLPESVFGQEPNMAVMHQAYLRQLANARQGTAKTKRRSEVAGGGAKPYRQKGTGRARHGSNREPSMVGGGTVFGPQPRSFAQRMPRKMRRLALRSALSVKADERKVSVLEGFGAADQGHGGPPAGSRHPGDGPARAARGQ